MASLDFFGLDYRSVSLLKKILISSLEGLNKEDKVMVAELIESCKEQQKRASDKLLNEINQITAGLSDNQRLFVLDAFFHGLTPFFDPYPVVELEASKEFNSKAIYQSKNIKGGVRLDCIE